MEFLRQVLFGKKQIFEKTALRIVDVPRWDEFNVKNFYDHVKNDKRFQNYLPDLHE